jgi:hypothetical protein
MNAGIAAYKLAGAGQAHDAKPPVTQGAKRVDRNPALDFTKGVLVLCMVLYHSMNYFMEDRGGALLRYLRFLPPSFIFITGFLLSNIYFVKYDVKDMRLHKRLLVRGLKLLVVFTLLNVATCLMLSHNYNGRSLGIRLFIQNSLEIYLTGNGRAAVFEVLLPISYLLILSGGLLVGCRWNRWFMLYLFVALFAGQLLLERSGHGSFNLGLFVIGLLGMVWGLVSMERINRWAGQVVLVSAAYAAYLLTITFWRENDLIQCCGVCLTLLLIYSIGFKWGADCNLQKLIIMLGKYSLVGYIAQIAVLQVIHRVLQRAHLHSGQFAIALAAASIFTILTVWVLDWSRARSKMTDRLYRAAFA